MAANKDKLEKLIVSLFEVNGLKFGSFTLKSGLISPVYFDLRVIFSHPKIFRDVCDLVGAEVEARMKAGQVDRICGVPYTALPIASLVCAQKDVPMLVKRKEKKSYGTGKLIEGEFSPGESCLIIEDVITSGGSIVEAAESLREHGLKITEAIVILDRGQGADVLLEESGIAFKALITMDKMLQVLYAEKLINEMQKMQVETFLKENQLFDRGFNKTISKLVSRISSKVSVKLINIMRQKQSNLCLSVDLRKWEDVLEAVELLGPKICMVKTHIDTLNLKGVKVINNFCEQLKNLSKAHNFLIMEDYKAADIGSTVEKQLTSKPFEISKWADLVTIHGISGPGILIAIDKLNLPNFGAVLIAEMSSEGNIPSLLPGYKDLVYKMGESQYSKVVAGFVSQSRPEQSKDSPYFLQFTPGVSLEQGAKGDGLGQQYNSVENAVLQRGADVIIVGRGILNNSKDKWVQITEQFRSKGWAAFKTKVANILNSI